MTIEGKEPIRFQAKDEDFVLPIGAKYDYKGPRLYKADYVLKHMFVEGYIGGRVISCCG